MRPPVSLVYAGLVLSTACADPEFLPRVDASSAPGDDGGDVVVGSEAGPGATKDAATGTPDEMMDPPDGGQGSRPSDAMPPRPDAEPVDGAAPGPGPGVEPDPCEGAPIAGEVLINFDTGTFVRQSAATFFETGSGGELLVRHAEVDRPRWSRLPGEEPSAPRALLLEGPRTNELAYSNALELPPWKAESEAMVATQKEVGPDGALSANRLSLTANSNSRVRQAAAATRLNADATFSVLHRAEMGGVNWRLQMRDSSWTDTGEAVQVSSPRWQRASLTQNLGSGTELVYAYIHSVEEAAELVASFAQREDGARFPSSPIVTTGSVGTRMGDELTFGPPDDGSEPDDSDASVGNDASVGLEESVRQLDEWAWEFDVYPEFANDEMDGPHTMMSSSAGLDLRLVPDVDGAVLELYDRNSGTRLLAVGPASFDRNQRLTLSLTPARGFIALSGATTGNGSASGAQFQVAGSDELAVGHSLGNGSPEHWAFARISEPRALACASHE